MNMPEWRNWQTRGIQNPVGFTPGGGSTPPFGTSLTRCRIGTYARSPLLLGRIVGVADDPSEKEG